MADTATVDPTQKLRNDLAAYQEKTEEWRKKSEATRKKVIDSLSKRTDSLSSEMVDFAGYSVEILRFQSLLKNPERMADSDWSRMNKVAGKILGSQSYKDVDTSVEESVNSVFTSGSGTVAKLEKLFSYSDERASTVKDTYQQMLGQKEGIGSPDFWREMAEICETETGGRSLALTKYQMALHSAQITQFGGDFLSPSPFAEKIRELEKQLGEQMLPSGPETPSQAAGTQEAQAQPTPPPQAAAAPTEAMRTEMVDRYTTMLQELNPDMTPEAAREMAGRLTDRLLERRQVLIDQKTQEYMAKNPSYTPESLRAYITAGVDNQLAQDEARIFGKYSAAKTGTAAQSTSQGLMVRRQVLPGEERQKEEPQHGGHQDQGGQSLPDPRDIKGMREKASKVWGRLTGSAEKKAAEKAGEKAAGKVVVEQAVKTVAVSAEKKAAMTAAEQAAVKAGLGKLTTRAALWIAAKFGTKIAVEAFIPVAGWILLAADIVITAAKALWGKVKGLFSSLLPSFAHQANMTKIKARSALADARPSASVFGASDKPGGKVGLIALLGGGLAATVLFSSVGGILVVVVLILIFAMAVASLFMPGQPTGQLISVEAAVDQPVLPNDSGKKVIFLVRMTAKDSDIDVTLSNAFTREKETSTTLSISTETSVPARLTKGQETVIQFKPYTLTSEDNDSNLVNAVTVTAKAGSKSETLKAQAKVKVGNPKYTDARCPIAPDGTPCAVSVFLPYFNNDLEAAQKASRICVKESDPSHSTWGNEKAVNNACTSGAHNEYSIGLFQINLFAHDSLCKQVLGGRNPFNKPFFARCVFGDTCDACQRDESLLEQCRDEWFKPERKAEYLRYVSGLSGNGTNWYPIWSTAGPLYCDIN